VILLVQKGADVSRVKGKHQKIVRRALCHIGIIYVVQAMRDETSSIYMGGFDIADVFYKSVLAIEDLKADF
jgi:hypothetical protein